MMMHCGWQPKLQLLTRHPKPATPSAFRGAPATPAAMLDPFRSPFPKSLCQKLLVYQWAQQTAVDKLQNQFQRGKWKEASGK